MILAAWSVALLWLIQRQYLRPDRTRLAEGALGVSPGAQFFRLSLGAQQLGYASTTVDTLRDTIRLVDVLVLDVPALGRLGRTEGRSVTTLDRALRLLGMTSELGGAAERFTAHATVTDENAFRVGVVTAGDSQVTSVSPGDRIELPSLWPLRLAFGGRLGHGRVVTIRVLDPFTLELRDRTFRVAAESTFILPDSADFDSTTMAWVSVRFDTVRAARVDATGPGGGRVTWWIDAQGHVVRGAFPMGFVIERTAFELAYENFRRRDTLRLMRATQTSARGDVVPITLLAAGLRPQPPTEATTLRVRLGGGDLGGLDLVGGRQRLDGDTLTIEREAAQLQGRYSLPDADTTLRDYLEPDLLSTSTDRGIQRQARLVAGAERDPARATAALVHWVATTVRGERSDAMPLAPEILARRRGDCNEHTVLFVALARALGLPARAVAGLLLQDGRYYYHAWAEVYLGDWVAVDPTFDQFPADVAHLRLIIGGLARPTDLAPRAGRLTLDTL